MNKVYNMKQGRFKLSGAYILILLLLSACTNNMSIAENEMPGEPVELKFSIGTRNAVQDDNLKSPLEWKMTTVRIYAFNGDQFDCMKYFNVPIGEQAQGFFTSSMVVQSAYNKKLIAIVNEPSSAKNYLDNVKTLDGLKSQDYQLIEYVDENATKIKESGLPMYGELYVNLSSTATDDDSPKDISISVERIMARVDIFMRSEAENTKAVKLDSQFKTVLQNSAERGYFNPALIWNELEEELSLNPVGTEETLTTTAVPIISFYVPERGFVTGNPMKLKLNFVSVGGEMKSYDPLVIGVASDGTTYDETIHGNDYKIKRNHIYQMTVTVSNTNRLPIDISVIPWTVVEENPDLYPDNL